MSKEKQIEEMAKDLCKLGISCEECTMLAHKTNQTREQYCKAMEYAKRAYEKGYRKQSENIIELPCKVGDLVHFKGLETPWKVLAIYEEGQPQISITSETGKITSTMTANEFYMFCAVLTEAEAKMKGGE